MNLDFNISTAGGAYELPQSTLDFRIYDLPYSAPVVTSASLSIAEDAATSTAVGTITATDADGDSVTWSIRSGNTGTAFAINSTTGVITVAAALDYRTKPSYTLVVRATDPSGLYGEANVIIALSSTAPVVTPAAVSIDEDKAIGTAVVTVMATDPNSDPVTWSIRSGNTSGAFSINSSTGVITVAANLDYRTKPSYTLLVRATDPGGRYGEDNVVISLNSTSPVVNAATFSIGELVPIGTTVGTVTAVDPQGDTDLDFSITAGNTGGAFAIDPSTGVITVAAVIDFETKPTYALTVLATDSTGRWGAGAITINLIDQIEIFLPPAPAFIVGLAAPWAKSESQLDTDLSIRFDTSRPLDAESFAAWSRMHALEANRTLVWQDMNARDVSESLLWSRLVAMPDRVIDLPWVTSKANDVSRDLPWLPKMQERDASLELDWHSLNVRDQGIVVVFSDVDSHPETGDWFESPQVVHSGASIQVSWPLLPAFDFPIRLTDSYSLPLASLDFNIPSVIADDINPPVAVRWAPFRAPSVRPHAVDGVELLLWGGGHPADKSQGFQSNSLAQLPGAGVDLPWNNDPPDFEQIVVPPLKVYNTMNTITVVRLPERTPINPIGLQVSYDETTFCWIGTLVLFSEVEANLLKPTPVTRREVEINVNGFVVVLSIQTRARERKFPNKTWTLQAKGRQAYLAEPYMRPRSLISSTLKSAAQLALDELPDGWLLDWQVPDWNIPAGMWSYNNLTPIKAIARLAMAVGAIVQPDPEDQKIVVRSRYPISPLQWYTSTPALSLPDAVCTTLSDTDQPADLYNQVIIEAARAPGIRVICTRTDTGGDDPLPSITEELCTATACGMERGRVELDATGPSIDQTTALPILAEPGVILPGILMEVTEGTNAWRGIPRAVSIAGQRTDKGWSVGQTLRIERREAV